MGTAILLPQDCLPASKGRHKGSFSDVLYGSDVTPTARGTFQVLDAHSVNQEQSRHKLKPHRRAGGSATPRSLTLTEQGQFFANTNALPRIDGRKTKARWAPVEPRDAKCISKPVVDVPVFTILQRPKDRDVANEVITNFLVKADEARPTVKMLCDMKLDFKANESKQSSVTCYEVKKGGSNFKKGMVEGPKDPKLDMPKTKALTSNTKVECSTVMGPKPKHHGLMFGSPKLPSVVRRSVHNRFDEVVSAKGLNQMLSLKVAEEYKNLHTAGVAESFSCKLAQANQAARTDKMLEGGLARLKRASTDPQIVKHLVGQYRSVAMEIPHSDATSFHGISRSSSMSCPERWAGPAYSSSPSPSSLPLPKFSLLNQKMSSPDCCPLAVEGCNTKSMHSPELGSVRALPGVHGGDMDVVSATRSLRRMLKLEPF